jgi:acyl-CoA thioester hydrolase
MELPVSDTTRDFDSTHFAAAAAPRREEPGAPPKRETAEAGRSYTTRLRVRYAETDQMGVVYHSNFIIWFEVGRVEALRQMGFTYKQMELDGCRLPVVEARCRYKIPAYYDEELVVSTRVKKVRSNLIHFLYEVKRAADDTLLAEGETVHFTVDLDGNKRVFPPKYMDVLRRAAV